MALAGDYRPLVDTLASMKVGAYLLEMCTPRAGELEILQALPDDARIGVGVVNQKCAHAEPVEEVGAKIARAIDLFGKDRLLFHPDCGFATFADNPICSTTSAEEKLQGHRAGGRAAGLTAVTEPAQDGALNQGGTSCIVGSLWRQARRRWDWPQRLNTHKAQQLDWKTSPVPATAIA